MFLPNYSSGRLISKPTAFSLFQLVWHVFANGLAFFHLGLATWWQQGCQPGWHFKAKFQKYGVSQSGLACSS